jgi:hypothetical protein
MDIEGETKPTIDTGSSVSILQQGVSRNEVMTTDIRSYGVIGDVLDVKGRQSLSFVLGGQEFHHSFWSAHFHIGHRPLGRIWCRD